jgi:hypothetical protein
MPSLRLPLTLLLAATAGCASQTAATRADPGAPGAAAGQEGIQPDVRVRIVDARYGAQRSTRSEPLLVPFGVNQNGSELVYVMLERATRAGAAYVGDLALTVTFRWRGDLVECRTPVMLAGDPRLGGGEAAGPEAPGSAYSTQIDVFSPQPVEVDVTDRELTCTETPFAVMKRRRKHNLGRSAERRSAYDGDPDQVETVHVVERRDVCRFETLSRRVTRYDYEVKLGFVPPRWEHFSERFADAAIVPGKPRCYLLAEAELGKLPEYRLTATAYHVGSVRVAMPVSLPSRRSVEAQFQPGGHIGEGTCIKILHAASQKKGGLESHCRPEMENAGRRRRLNDLDEEILPAED